MLLLWGPPLAGFFFGGCFGGEGLEVGVGELGVGELGSWGLGSWELGRLRRGVGAGGPFLYLGDMDSTKRFSDRVEDYVKYRPGYPDAVVSTLGVEPWMVVADIGSGTGISTEPFLRRGNTVYAVEPNADMRAKAEELLGGYAGFVSVGGKAEATGLADGSVDLIVAGQAFHWFDPVGTRAEWVRIARKGLGVGSGVGAGTRGGAGVRAGEGTRVGGGGGARAALIWNERLMVMPFEAEYEELILTYAGDYKTINHKNITGEQVGRFFAPEDYVLYQFENGQDLDFEGLKGRLLSSSYIPKEGARYEEMMRALVELFGRYAQGGMVRVRYDTKMYVGKIG